MRLRGGPQDGLVQGWRNWLFLPAGALCFGENDRDPTDTPGQSGPLGSLLLGVIFFLSCRVLGELLLCVRIRLLGGGGGGGSAGGGGAQGGLGWSAAD